MKVIGMDISKGVATCVMLEELPQNLAEFTRSKEFVYWHIKPKTEDLEAIASLEPDLIVFEPSGGRYETAIRHFMRAKGIDIRQVAGRRLAVYRAEAKLQKDDHFDALAIAAYGLEKHREREAFIPETTPEIELLRQQWLQRHSLMNQRNGAIARLRQNLAAEFPEAMEFDSNKKWGGGSCGLILWLAGEGDPSERGVKMWQTRYEGGKRRSQGKRIEQPPSCGIGISSYTRLVARQLLEVERAIGTIEAAIDDELKRGDYAAYIQAMDALCFGQSMKAIWLTRIYPFSKFLDEGGRERISKRLSSNGRWRTHNHSLAQFKAALGAAVDMPRSGTSGGIAPTKQRSPGRNRKSHEEKKRPIGCKFCRVTFWQWATVQIETKTASSEHAKTLGRKRDEWKAAGKNLFQRSGLLHGYASKLLYRELKKALL
ncbi:transposase [Nodosilinea sp. LEGE 07298]|uniref:IS110 family transposase n=1 Tax=Nodosilinea sp. LEGE 07298 TaxID=2777970 RepID=UPI00188106C1|nr:transposase [Nodosilinea sp. LEGE 07298]MBE9113759.1 transposase [Nodosilinea sp. LEGE 07298]